MNTGVYHAIEVQVVILSLDVISEKNIFSFLYPATLKRAGYYVIPSIQKIAFRCPSV